MTADDKVRLLYEEDRGPMFRALVAWTGSIDVADEAVAEAFTQLLRRGDEVRDPKLVRARRRLRVLLAEPENMP